MQMDQNQLDMKINRSQIWRTWAVLSHARAGYAWPLLILRLFSHLFSIHCGPFTHKSQVYIDEYTNSESVISKTKNRTM
jgi:hypothetical protein